MQPQHTQSRAAVRPHETGAATAMSIARNAG